MKRWSIILVTIVFIYITFLVNNRNAIDNSENKTSSSLTPQDIIDPENEVIEVSTISKDVNVYQLNLRKWGIFNDGTHPEETTKGFNEALRWAQREGYKTFYVPPGTYLISKGKEDNDPEARINLVSNMTFLLDDKTVIQKETNGFEIYSTLFLDSDIENVTIKGGIIRGDRDTHDYSQKGEYTSGTHEWGNGIDTAGAQNIVIDGVKIERFTGDGIEIGGATIYGDYITDDDVEMGGIDDNGNLILKKGKIRTKNYEVSNFRHPVYKNPHYRNIMMWIPEGVEGNYDIFFYRKDDSFISVDRDMRFNSTWGYSEIPDDADYFKVVFNSDTTNDIKVNRMTVAITKNITIKNCDIGFNRRQGITVGASDGVEITNNKIHNTNGTAPESGIDIEPGFFPAINTIIRNNQFVKNQIQMVFAYGGNAIVEDNYFGPNVERGGGFTINPAYYGASVKNNKFEQSSFTTWGHTEFRNNELISSSAFFDGGNNVIVEEIVGIDSNIEFNQTEKDGIKVANILLTSSRKDSSTGGLFVYGKPIHMKNITLEGNNEFSGEGNSKSVYDDFSFNDSPDMNLAFGIYNNCSMKNTAMELNNKGKIIMDKCQFKNTMFYTYNTESEATFQNSNFESEGISILALEAKNINVLNNTFNVVESVEIEPIIQIGRDASESNPTKIFDTTIKGNTFISKSPIIGIDTKNGGVGAPPYIIENNTLLNAKLNLKNNDINKNNKLK
ncbi:right-handed parallel beta-helix repeat-containing protein [Lederbergia citrisecunda]|uniref:right-handed parallel beta-helix repeat-containing protein n=1 Tax=Lederbergia citrisecunda TaxID=2833583 RepID=UPI0032E802BD